MLRLLPQTAEQSRRSASWQNARAGFEPRQPVWRPGGGRITSAGAGPQPQAPGQFIQTSSVERAVVDQPECTRDCSRRTHPRRRSRRCLGPAPQARTKTGLRGGRRRHEVAKVLLLGCRRRTDRPAVDAGRGHSDEEAPVKSGIPGMSRPPPSFHHPQLYATRPPPARRFRTRIPEAPITSGSDRYPVRATG